MQNDDGHKIHNFAEDDRAAALARSTHQKAIEHARVKEAAVELERSKRDVPAVPVALARSFFVALTGRTLIELVDRLPGDIDMRLLISQRADQSKFVNLRAIYATMGGWGGLASNADHPFFATPIHNLDGTHIPAPTTPPIGSPIYRNVEAAPLSVEARAEMRSEAGAFVTSLDLDGVQRGALVEMLRGALAMGDVRTPLEVFAEALEASPHVEAPDTTTKSRSRSVT